MAEKRGGGYHKKLSIHMQNVYNKISIVSGPELEPEPEPITSHLNYSRMQTILYVHFQ